MVSGILRSLAYPLTREVGNPTVSVGSELCIGDRAQPRGVLSEAHLPRVSTELKWSNRQNPSQQRPVWTSDSTWARGSAGIRRSGSQGVRSPGQASARDSCLQAGCWPAMPGTCGFLNRRPLTILWRAIAPPRDDPRHYAFRSGTESSEQRHAFLGVAHERHHRVDQYRYPDLPKAPRLHPDGWGAGRLDDGRNVACSAVCAV